MIKEVFPSTGIVAHMWSAPGYASEFSTYFYTRPGTSYYIVCVDPVSDESDATNNCSTGVSVTATPLTASRTCIVGYVLTPYDKCSHPDESSLIFRGNAKGQGWMIYSANQIDSMTTSSQNTIQDIRIKGVTYHVKWQETSVGNWRIIELSSRR